MSKIVQITKLICRNSKYICPRCNSKTDIYSNESDTCYEEYIQCDCGYLAGVFMKSKGCFVTGTTNKKYIKYHLKKLKLQERFNKSKYKIGRASCRERVFRAV